MNSLTRGEIAPILHLAAEKFFAIFSHKNNVILFHEVHLNESLRVDVLSISWDDRVTVFEIKTCRDDFEKDMKWKKYLDYCDKFMFMCPDGVIKPEELPPNVGLVYVGLNNPTNPWVKVIKQPKTLKPSKLNSAWFRATFKKLAFRKFCKVGGKLISLENEHFFD